MDGPCLPGLPSPHPGEGFNGYLLRLADLNGYEPFATLHKVAGYVGLPLVFRPENIPPIATLINMSEADVLRMSYEQGSTTANRKKSSFLGHEVFHYLIDAVHPKLCPACVRGTGFLQALWDLTPVIACPIHGRLLVDHCRECGRPLSWHRRNVRTSLWS